MIRLTLKGLVAHKLRFALTALAVVLGVAFLSGTLVLTDTIRRTFDDLFANVYKGTDAVVRSSESIDTQFGTQRGRVSASLVPRIEAVDGVAREDGRPVVHGQLTFQAQLVDKHGDPIGNPGAGAPTLGFVWNPFRQLNVFHLVEGRAPERDDQVVIDKGSADKAGFHVGDRVTVQTAAPPAAYTIAGIAKFGDADSPAGASVTLFTQARAQQITGSPDQYDEISVAASPGVSQAELVSRVRDAVGGKGVEVVTGEKVTKENQDQIEKSLSFFNTALLIFALVALFVGCFLIFNTFSIIVAQRNRELALMRAIGASGRQVMTSVLGESFGVGLLASIVGLGAGIVLSAGLKAVLAGFGIDIPAGGTVVLARTVVLAIVVGTVVTVVSAVFPARRAARVPPMAAMRDVAFEAPVNLARRTAIGVVVTGLGVIALLFGLLSDVKNGIALVGAGAVATFLGVAILGPLIARPIGKGIGWPMSRLRGMPGTLARENAVRNPRRTASTAIALTIGVALVGLIMIFASSTKASISVAIDRAFRADFVIAPKGSGFGPGFTPDVARAVSQVPQVEAVSGLRFAPIEVNGKSAFAAASDPTTITALFDVQPKAGNFERMTPSGIAVAKKVADDHNWRVGTRLRLKTQNGTFPVAVEAIYGAGQQQGLSDYFLPISAWDRYFTQDLDNQVYVKLAPGVSAAAADRAITRAVKPYETVQVEDRAEFKARQEQQINQLVNLIYVLLALAVLIALIGIANTLALSIVERTRELGLLRAVGMTRAQLRSAVRWESVIIALLGTALGLVIGFFFGWAIVRALRDQGITEFALPAGQLIVVVVLAALAALGAAAFPARRASKLDVLRAIATE